MSAVAAVPAPTAVSTTELLVRFARAGHMAGYTTNELEDRVATLALRLGVPMVEVSAAPTSVQVAVGPIARQEVHTLRVRPAPVEEATRRVDDQRVRAVARELD